MTVLGIDIGLRTSGYVVCGINKYQLDLIKEGEIKTDKIKRLGARLFFIHQEVERLFKEYNPEAMVIEKLYSHYRHPTTISLLAQVRAVVIIIGEKYGVGIYEYSSTRARKSFLGRGNCNSNQVKKMAENITGRKFLSSHTADAFSLVAVLANTLRKSSYSKI